MEIITYSLRNGRKQSDRYYQDVATFTDRVLAEAESQLAKLATKFQAHVQQTGHEAPRSCPEYIFELLTLGVLWRVYISKALGLSKMLQWPLARLSRLRERGGTIKPLADMLRGILSRPLLSISKRHADGEEQSPSLIHLKKLLDWLEASGDFKQESRRLRAWQAFFAKHPRKEAAKSLLSVISFADWFEKRSVAALGCYTPEVEHFLTATHPGYRWREDFIFCGRQRVEYHLNMVGTEILNRSFQEAFFATTKKAVLAPPCMRAKPDGQCQAQSTSLGALCAGCTPGCRIHQLSKLGEKRGFAVLILPEDLSVFPDGRAAVAEGTAMGVVGISCVLTNAPGGWETKALGVPAQGVLLDYCGCSWHWHKEGIPTDINLHQLLKVLGIKKGKPSPAGW